ncbi:TPA: hypothetical protein QDZ28_000783 [Pseudomonas putida]|nr:hypothetical protein [Pseudomonas putida]
MYKPTRIHWHPIDKFGLPPRELRKTDQGLDRTFMVKTDEGLKASSMFEDGSGFEDLGTGVPIAWAYAPSE